MLHLYRVRLRARLVQECFALVGIAAGVALLFASQVASESLSSSVAQLSHGVVGNASLQLLARDPQGMPEALLQRVRSIPGVRAAAPLLEASAYATGPRASDSVELVGADSSLRQLGGALVRHTELEAFAGIGAVLLPAPLAARLGVRSFGKEVALQLYGRSEHAPLYKQLTAKQIGGLVASPIVVAPLFYAQELTGLAGRVSRILVQPAAGRQGQVRAALLRLAAARLDVQSTSYDERLFAKAASASNSSTALFALISALVGFLFAFNAMLLTVPQRRRLIADLRRDGYTPATVVGVLLLDALALGLLACVLGLALGDELSIHLFRSNPGYLGSAFSVGTQRVVGWQSIVVAVAGGMLAAIVAVLSPLRDILSRDPLAAITPREGGAARRTSPRTALAGVACLAAASAIVIAAPKEAILGMVLLIGALLLVLPLALGVAVALLARLARRITGATAHVAAMELSAARARAIGVAATGAIAVFGAVAIQGAHADLLHGLENAARDENAFTDLWVSPPGSYDLLRTAPFAATQQTSLGRLPGVRSVGVYRGGLLDWGERRVWVIAPPAQATPLLPASQILEGSLPAASARVRAGGWVVLSQALAAEHHLHIGQRVTLPTPVPTTVRVAAFSTNIGWAPGAMIMSAAQYARRVGEQRRERVQHPARAARVLHRRGRRGHRGARTLLGPVGAERGGARRRTERPQPSGPSAFERDRDADPGGGGAGDGGGDRQHGLAAPPAACEAEARGVRALGAVAHDPARERPAAGDRLPGGRAVRPLRPAAAGPGARRGDQLPRRLLGRLRSGDREPGARDGGGRGDHRAARLSRDGGAGRRRAGGLMVSVRLLSAGCARAARSKGRARLCLAPAAPGRPAAGEWTWGPHARSARPATRQLAPVTRTPGRGAIRLSTGPSPPSAYCSACTTCAPSSSQTSSD